MHLVLAVVVVVTTLLGMDITKAQKERQETIIREYYSKPIRFDGGAVTTRREYIGERLVGKKIRTTTHAKRKVNGCYARLVNPKIEYTLALASGDYDRPIYIDCPKTVFDATMAIEL
jgi:hypothetical protein